MKITTCQICERLIKANTGVIAHHGYQRPGDGWQTGSCFGARALPLQLSRDRLGEWIAALRDMRDRQIGARDRVQDETQPISLQYTDRSKPRNPWGQRETVDFAVSRGTWDDMKALHAVGWSDRWISFDAVKLNDIRTRDAETERLGKEIERQQRRFDGWRPSIEEAV